MYFSPAAGEPRAVCLHLASSGDEGFGMRLRFAAPLLERGIAALVLENPYYGERRPTGQPGPAPEAACKFWLNRGRWRS